MAKTYEEAAKEFNDRGKDVTSFDPFRGAPHTISKEQREKNYQEAKAREEECRKNGEALKKHRELKDSEKDAIQKSYDNAVEKYGDPLDEENIEWMDILEDYPIFSLENLKVWFGSEESQEKQESIVNLRNIEKFSEGFSEIKLFNAWSFIGIAKYLAKVFRVEAKIEYVFGEDKVRIIVKRTA